VGGILVSIPVITRWMRQLECVVAQVIWVSIICINLLLCIEQWLKLEVIYQYRGGAKHSLNKSAVVSASLAPPPCGTPVTLSQQV